MSLLDHKLVHGHPWGRIGDFYEVTKKPRGLDPQAVSEVPFATMDAIPQGGAYTPAYTLKAPQEIRSGTYFECGDILVAKITPSFENGKQALVTDLPAPFGFATTEVIPLRPKSPGHDRRLLFFYLLHPDVRHHIAERMEGSTGRQRVPTEVLLDVPYPAFPPPDQAIVANVLESLLRLKSLTEKSITTVQSLKRAAMQALFTRGLRGEAQKETEIGPMPESWELVALETVCDIVSGGTPRKSNGEYWDGSIPWVSGKDLKSASLSDSTDHVSEEGARVGTRLVPEGSVLLLVRGMGLAKDLPVAVIERPMTFNQDIKALLPRNNCSGSFLRSAIYIGKERLLSLVVTSAHGTMTLGLRDVQNFMVPLPSDPAEAGNIIAILDTIDRKAELHRRKRDVLEELFRALLHKLMTGEIRVGDLDLAGAEVAKRSAIAAVEETP